MGEIADYYRDQELDRMLFQNSENERSREITWTSQDGRVYRPHEMTDSHLLNCLHLCERREGNKGEGFLNQAPTYYALTMELIKRKRLDRSYFKLPISQRLEVKLEVEG